MFKDIDKEADGEIYYREMVTYLKSLDRDMDQQSNPLVCLILVLNALTQFFFKQRPCYFFKIARLISLRADITFSYSRTLILIC